jgi:hypothetical protein
LADFVKSLETGFISADISNPDNNEQIEKLTDFRNVGEITSRFPVLAKVLN